MKINVCDPCKRLDNVITETNRYFRVKGKSFLNIDVCEKHRVEVKKLSMVDYVRYVFKMNGMPVEGTDQQIKDAYLT